MKPVATLAGAACAGILALLSPLVQAQQATGLYEDAIQFSQQNPTYTTRMNGLGGASTGLGADISNASTNPAGLGLLRKSEFSITPAVLATHSYNSSARAGAYQGFNTDTSASRFFIGNLGLAFSRQRSEINDDAFRGGTFAITLNRTANYSNVRSFKGNAPYEYGGNLSHLNGDDSLNLGGRNGYNSNYTTLLSNDFTQPYQYTGDLLNTSSNDGNLTTNQYLIRQAYGSYVLDFDSTTGKFYLNIPNGDYYQRGSVRTIGRQQQLDFAYGANFSNKLYIGGGIGIPFLYQDQYIVYDEQLTNALQVRTSNNVDFSLYNGIVTRREMTSNTTGAGINLKLGGIYQVSKNVRLGASFQSPSWMRITNDFYTVLSADFKGKNLPGLPTPDGTIVTGDIDRVYRTEYNIRTPMRASFGATLLDGQYGFVTAEATYVGYGNTSVKGLNGVNLSGDNAAIKSLAQDVIEFRAGAEGKYKIARFRVGGSLLPNPYKSVANAPYKNLLTISAGGGVRLNNYYIDLGFQRYVYQGAPFQVYRGGTDLSPSYSSAIISSDLRNTVVQLTFGSYF